jgi:UDP-glucuronate decarboxylase
MQTILVTGGAGNIGSAFVNKLSSMGYMVVVADNLLTGSLSKVPKEQNVKFIKSDVNNFNDISALFYTYKFDYVFHFAAVVGVQRTLNNPIWVLNDIDGIRNVLQLSKNTGVKRIFYSSSSEVYGEPFEIPQNEFTTPLNSRLPYAIIKNLGEAFYRAFHTEYNLEYTIFRFFNTYGPNQSEDFVVPKFIKSAMRGNAITVYGDGKQTRTFCYVDDNVDACLSIFTNNLFLNDVVNIGNDVEMTVMDLAKKVVALVNPSVEIINLPRLEEGDMTRRCPDITKMKEALDRPMTQIDEGIMKLLSFYKSQQQ